MQRWDLLVAFGNYGLGDYKGSEFHIIYKDFMGGF